MGSPSAWLRARRPSGEAGTTLMELMVAMTVMSIFMGIATTAVVSMYSSTNKSQAVVNTSAQLDTAFDRLDKQVRYASAIDEPVPSTVNTYWSVVFARTDLGPMTCTQLAAGLISPGDQSRLAERTWTLNSDGSLATPIPAQWSQLALGISNGQVPSGSPDQPFSLPTNAGATVQQLRLKLIAVDGSGKSPMTSVTEITFSALNSDAVTPPSGAASTAPPTPPNTSACGKSAIS